jgi:hypothetical protein
MFLNTHPGIIGYTETHPAVLFPKSHRVAKTKTQVPPEVEVEKEML